MVARPNPVSHSSASVPSVSAGMRNDLDGLEVRSGRGALGDHQRVLVGPLDLAGPEGGHEALQRLGQLRLTVEREGGIGMGLDAGFEDTDRDPPGEAILLHPEKLETGGVPDGPFETVPLEKPGFLVAEPGKSAAPDGAGVLLHGAGVDEDVAARRNLSGRGLEERVEVEMVD